MSRVGDRSYGMWIAPDVRDRVAVSFFESMSEYLDEKILRLSAGALALALGEGSARAVAIAAGVSGGTVAAGVRDLADGSASVERVRRAGAGRTPIETSHPGLWAALDALLAAYPDALVIQTHRGPRTAIASACSLAAHASEGWSTVFTGQVIGQTQLDLWARGLALFTAERARHDPAHFYDVQYEDLVADPFGTVEAIYQHFALPLSGAAADAIRALTDASARTRADGPGRQYTLEAFGLNGEEVDERFVSYMEHLALPYGYSQLR